MLHSSWMKVFVGAVFEVGWVIGLKHAESILEWLATIICIIIRTCVAISTTRY